MVGTIESLLSLLLPLHLLPIVLFARWAHGWHMFPLSWPFPWGFWLTIIAWVFFPHAPCSPWEFPVADNTLLAPPFFGPIQSFQGSVFGRFRVLPRFFLLTIFFALQMIFDPLCFLRFLFLINAPQLPVGSFFFLPFCQPGSRFFCAWWGTHLTPPILTFLCPFTFGCFHPFLVACFLFPQF